MKKITVFFLSMLLIILSSVTALSVDVDGYDNGDEWIEAEALLLLNGESNCKVNFGLIKWKIEPDTSTVYFCVMFKEPDLAADNTNVGASIRIENSDFYTVSVSSSDNEIDEDRYSFTGAVSVDANDGVTCEIKFGLKYGIPDIINGSVRFLDSDGIPSNVYDFTIRSAEIVSEEQKHYNSGSSSRTTTHKTTTQKTTKAGKTTTKSEKTTKSKQTDSSNSLWLLDMILNDISTKTESSTAALQTKSETEKKTQKKNKTSTQKLKTVISEINSATASGQDKETQYTSGENRSSESSIGLEKGDKYKTITLIAGGITLVAISVLGTVNPNKRNKSAETENDPKS